MFDPVLARLAWRSLWRMRRRTLITIASISLGCALAVFFICIAEGFYAHLVEDAVRMQTGHVTIEDPGYRDAPSADLMVRDATAIRDAAARLPGVTHTKVVIEAQVLVKTATGSVGAALMGVEPGIEKVFSPLAGRIAGGRYLEPGDGALAVIGAGMAERLRLGPGRKLVLSANNIRGELVEELCRVAGVFRIGSEEVDGYLVQVPVSFARRLLGMPPGSATRVGLILADSGRRHAVARGAANLPAAHGTVSLVWEEVMPELAAYIRLDRGTNLLTQFMLLFLVLFTIFNTVLMSVLERRHEFAVLLALGTPPARLRSQVMLEVLMLNLAGCAAGLALGGSLVLYFQVYGMDLSVFYNGEMSISGVATPPVLHPRFTPGIAAFVGGTVFAVTTALSLYPVWRAPRIVPAEAMR